MAKTRSNATEHKEKKKNIFRGNHNARNALQEDARILREVSGYTSIQQKYTRNPSSSHACLLNEQTRRSFANLVRILYNNQTLLALAVTTTVSTDGGGRLVVPVSVSIEVSLLSVLAVSTVWFTV